MREKRAKETSEQAEIRRERNRTRAKERRAKETPQEKKSRLECQKKINKQSRDEKKSRPLTDEQLVAKFRKQNAKQNRRMPKKKRYVCIFNKFKVGD